MSQQEFVEKLNEIREASSEEAVYMTTLVQLKNYAGELFEKILSTAIEDKKYNSKKIVDEIAQALLTELVKKFPGMKISLANPKATKTYYNNLSCEAVLGKYRLWLSEANGGIYVCVESLEIYSN